MNEIKPEHYVTQKECQEMIDDAIRKHNRNAGIISMFVGFFILGLFSEGLLKFLRITTTTYFPAMTLVALERLVHRFHLGELLHELALASGHLNRGLLGLQLHHGRILREAEGCESVLGVRDLWTDGAEEVGL